MSFLAPGCLIYLELLPRHFFDDPAILLKDVASPIPLLRSYISADELGGGGGGTGILHASDCPAVTASSPNMLDAGGVDDVSIVTSGSRLSYSSEELPERDDPVSDFSYLSIRLDEFAQCEMLSWAIWHHDQFILSTCTIGIGTERFQIGDFLA